MTFSDSDGNGQIEKDDFDLIGNKIGKLRNWAAGSARHTALKKKLDEIWDGVKQADADGNGSVSEEEWLKFWSVVILNKKSNEVAEKYQEFIFDALDVSGDGKVDEQEFAELYSGLGVPAEKCAEAFSKLTAVSI